MPLMNSYLFPLNTLRNFGKVSVFVAVRYVGIKQTGAFMVRGTALYLGISLHHNTMSRSCLVFNAFVQNDFISEVCKLSPMFMQALDDTLIKS